MDVRPLAASANIVIAAPKRAAMFARFGSPKFVGENVGPIPERRRVRIPQLLQTGKFSRVKPVVGIVASQAGENFPGVAAIMIAQGGDGE